MILYKHASDLAEYLQRKRQAGRLIGFVPTMGALHPGHLSLVNHSIQNNHITVASIFVNPTQFNDPADYEKYPVTLENDLFLLEKTGCDLVFLPSVTEIYPEGITGHSEVYELGKLESLLEGKFRPGHFQGVCRVVDRLLAIVNPDTLFLGQKDYQQCMVISRLIEITGRHTTLSIVPTLRETSGLAMSSRNLRLSEKDRETATAIYHSLMYIKEQLAPGDTGRLLAEARKKLQEAGLENTDYISIADATTLQPVDQWNGTTKLVALAAAFVNGVRLIDNMTLN